MEQENKTEICTKELLQQALQIMMQKNHIGFEGWSRMTPYRDVVVQSEIFTDKKFIITVDRSEWESYPDETVAETLAELLMEGKLSFQVLPRYE